MGEANLESDLKTSTAIGELVQDEDTANALYAAMCNRAWRHIESGDVWACSWRYSGGVVAEIRGVGDYMSHYCTGNEGRVDPSIEKALNALGWKSMSREETEEYYREGATS